MVRIEGTVASIDLTGLRCPNLARRIRKALARAAVGEQFEFLCTDPLAAIDIPHLVAGLGDEVVATRENSGRISFLIRRGRRGSDA